MLRLILFIIVVFFLFTFSYMNQEEQISLHFIGGGPFPPVPAYLIVIGSFLIGILFAVLMTFPGWLKMKLEKRKLNKRIEVLEADLDHLRAEALRTSGPKRPAYSTDDDSQDDTMGDG
ncbi:lipopolysaccharide assembly protein LapA domain-containing protein [Candidatus Manganitrophus noduliformans]|uniref:LapA family protein n=1 Tax=Candidatus Manganitrophus noduliformans TaxID=2606439 RepID=A0A7X6DTW1_9BACT|nr:LapA family protein [Candidatus Manganitrophus noduliformans]NKE73306.1 LapA family protein [Candidatus Manganitrophus noduliformans]